MAPLKKVRRYSFIVLLALVCLFVAVLTYGRHEKANTVSVRWNSPLQTESVKVWPQCREYSDDGVASAQVLSKELVVRRVVLDPRRRDRYPNATVFIMEAKGMTLNKERFSGCQVGHFFSDRFRFRKPRNYEWVQRHEHATSTLALIDCYDIPMVETGDLAYLHYNSSAGVVVKIQSQKPVFVPEPRAGVDSSTVTAVVCVGAPIYAAEHSAAEHGMLYHWLHYQKVVGVDHVHMYVDESFVRAGALQNEVIQQAIREGFLSIDFWPKWLNTTEVFNTQKIAFQDCLHRFQGVYDYVMHLDSDDFFVPLKSKSVKDYLVRWCSGKIGSCQFQWHQFFPDCGWDPNSIGADGNFTAAITHTQVLHRHEAKSAHQLKALLDAGTHYAMARVKGYTGRNVPSKEAYFSHVRFGWLPDKGCSSLSH